MKFYIASSLINYQQVRDRSRLLKKRVGRIRMIGRHTVQ